MTVESTNSGGSSSGGGGFAETDFSTASCASSIDAVGAEVVTGVGGGDHQLVRVCLMIYFSFEFRYGDIILLNYMMLYTKRI